MTPRFFTSVWGVGQCQHDTFGAALTRLFDNSSSERSESNSMAATIDGITYDLPYQEVLKLGRELGIVDKNGARIVDEVAPGELDAAFRSAATYQWRLPEETAAA